MLLMLMAFLPVIFFMFFTSRSQQKKQKELESKLKKGDRVVTQSGLVGKLVDTGRRAARQARDAPGVKVHDAADRDRRARRRRHDRKSKDEPAPADKK